MVPAPVRFLALISLCMYGVMRGFVGQAATTRTILRSQCGEKSSAEYHDVAPDHGVAITTWSCTSEPFSRIADMQGVACVVEVLAERKQELAEVCPKLGVKVSWFAPLSAVHSEPVHVNGMQVRLSGIGVDQELPGVSAFPGSIEVHVGGSAILPIALPNAQHDFALLLQRSLIVTNVTTHAQCVRDVGLSVAVTCTGSFSSRFPPRTTRDTTHRALAPSAAAIDNSTLHFTNTTLRRLAVSITCGPYLQAVGQTMAVVMWRQSEAGTGSVAIGSTAGGSNIGTFAFSSSTTDPVVQITGLSPSVR